MRFALTPRDTLIALRAIDRKRPERPRKDEYLTLTANVDGLTFGTNGATAFVPAHVAAAGACAIERRALLAVLRTFPPDAPLSVSLDGERLVVGRLRIPVRYAFASRGNA